MAVILEAGERLLGSKINMITGGKTHIIGEIGKRGAKKTVETNVLGQVIKKTPIAPKAEQVLAYFK